MPVWICVTCANQYPDTGTPPAGCVICSDERQWVPSAGQRWTTTADLAAAGHRGDVREVEPGLLGVGADPPVAIGQRALVIQTPGGNLMWDPPGFCDDESLDAVRGAAGGHRQPSALLRFHGGVEPCVWRGDPCCPRPTRTG